jgi:hypothetical protein
MGMRPVPMSPPIQIQTIPADDIKKEEETKPDPKSLLMEGS